ncbi:MAG: hypothetical protein V1809_08735 [Planctomycetota bacterium]
MTIQAGLEPLQLKWQERNRQIVITPEDEDRFAVTVEAAIAACRAVEGMGKFRSQFKTLLKRLAEWLGKHGGDVSNSYITVRDADLLFLVVQKAKAYQRDFEDALTELDIEVAQDRELNQIRLSVLAIPASSPESVASFLHPENSIIYHHAD